MLGTPRVRATKSVVPKKVAFCVDNLNVGGTELNAVRTAERLVDEGYHLQVCSLQEDGPLLARYRAAGIEVCAFPLANLYGAASQRQGLTLVRWLRGNGVQILHAHDIYSNVFGVFWGRMAGVRTIASRRWWEGPAQPHWRLASRAGYACADVTLANSETVGRLLQREGVPARKIAVVPNFLDEHAFETLPDWRREMLRSELGLLPHHRVIGKVANLLPVKDHRSLIRAFARLGEERPELRLVLIGDGSERAALETLAGELGLDGRVVFAGRRTNHPNLHQLFDVSVQSSISEGLPNSLLEAMAAGRPVVATAVGAVGDAVVHGGTGLLVPAGDPERLSAALGSMLDDPARARAMGEAGRVRARARYSAGPAMRELEALYRRLTPAGRSAGNVVRHSPPAQR